MKVRAHYYQQFDADHRLEVPAATYGGWQTAEIEISRRHSALAVMHAWNLGTAETYPGWWRAVEYMSRAQTILRDVFPPLLAAVREARMRVFHIVGGGHYYQHLPGYQHTVELAGPAPPRPEQIPVDKYLERLRVFRAEHVFVGRHNEADVARGFEGLDFAPEAVPQPGEPIAEDRNQLYALCRHYGISHLIYAGFAVNWCMLLSPGGMADMSRHGIMCSVLREATTAVENRETARAEVCKEVALWRIALAYGFVFDLPDFLDALKAERDDPFD